MFKMRYSVILLICNVILCVLFCIYKNGETPLMRSVHIGNLDLCKLLIDNGALSSINTPNNVSI